MQDLGRTLSSQRYELERFPILINSREEKRFEISSIVSSLGPSHSSEAALSYHTLEVIATPTSPEELNQEYDRTVVQPLSSWSAYNKLVKRDSLFSNMVMRVKSPSEDWTLMKSMLERDDGTIIDNENVKKNFE